MMLDIYNYFKNHPRYNKLVGNDFLLVEYKCPLNSEEFKLWTDNHLITYVISGKKDWTSVNETYTIEKGEALFIRKGVYNTKQYFEVDYCVLLFFMTDRFIRNFLKDKDTLCPTQITDPPSKQIFKLQVNHILDSLFLTVFNYLNQDNIPKDLVELKFHELLYNIILNPANQKLIEFMGSLRQEARSNLDDVMNKNFHYDLKLEDFARLSGRSLSTFKRDFNSYYQQTPGFWLNTQRLDYARILLETSDLNVNEICYESGFKNASHFNKAFKEKYQLPPQRYRKSLTLTKEKL